MTAIAHATIAMERTCRATPARHSSLREAGLIDEYRLCVAPLLLGKTGGAPMFKRGDERQRLDLIQAEAIKGGGVLLFYRPIA